MRFRSTYWLPAVILGLLCVVVALWLVVEHARRPLFVNLYARNDRMLIPAWIEAAPGLDSDGNRTYFDQKRNLIVTFRNFTNMKGDVPYVTLLESGPEKATFLLDDSGTQFTIWARDNEFLLIYDQSEYAALVIEPDTARAIYDIARQRTTVSFFDAIQASKAVGRDVRIFTSQYRSKFAAAKL